MSEVEIQYIIVEDSESATQYLVYPPRDKAIIPAGHTVHFPAQSIAAVNLTGERLLAYLKVTDDTGKLLHYKEEYTRDYYYNDEFSTTMPPRDYSITVEAGLVGGGTPHVVTFTIHLGPNYLTVDSTPVKGIPFVIDNKQYATPTTLQLPPGTYTIAMPKTHTDPETGVTYAFDHWEDGSTNPTRTINLTADTTITATYTPPPETAILTGTVKGVLGTPVRNAKVTLNGFQTSTDQQGKFTITDIPLGAYTLRVEHILYETYTASIEMTTAGTYEVTIQLSLKNTIKGAAIGVVAALIISIFLARR